MSAERERADQAVRMLWLAMAELMDTHGPGVMTKEDADVWGAAVRHPAIQRRLDEAMKRKVEP